MYKLKTAPASEPVSLAEAKTHLRVDSSAEDDLINSLISAARQWAEKYTNRSFITQTWELYLDDLYECIELQYGAVQSVTSVKYYDTDNSLQTLSSDNYDTDLISLPARITRAYNVTYPNTYNRTNAVIIEFTAGYGDASDVPDSIKSAILLLVGHLYENRENVVWGQVKSLPQGTEFLLNPYRVFTYG